MKRVFLITAILALFLCTGCGSSNQVSDGNQPATPVAPSADGYMDNEATQVIYIQWTESNGQLAGSWNTAVLDQNNKIVYNSLPITGIHNNDTGSISFVINANGKLSPINGTLLSGNLQLQMQQDGQLTQWKLYPVRNIDYQAALTAFKAKAS